jgi:ribosome maturation factor RimP
MQKKHALESLLEPVIDSMGYEIVRMLNVGANANMTLQIMIERKDRKDITVDDCVKVSRAVSEVLDEHDPIEDNYNLEVSSPGLDRPLTKLENFERFKGFEAKIETFVGIENRKRFKGKLLGVFGKDVKIDTEGVEYAIPFDDITKAKLVLTDDLIKANEEEIED